MDDRTGAKAMIGTFLVTSSVLRAQHNAERAFSLRLRHDLTRFSHSWQHRARRASALGTCAVGLAVLFAAGRASTRAAPEEGAEDLPAPSAQRA